MAPVADGHADQGPASYWQATSELACPDQRLDRDLSVEVAIIGGGYTGLSAAHHLARRGVDCAVLEANAIGWGASGRSAGFLVLRYKHGFSALAARHGADDARRLHAMLFEALGAFDEIVTEYGLTDFVARSGHLTAAHSAQAAAGLAVDSRWLAREAADTTPRILARAEMQEATGTDAYVGGYLDPRGGAIHPLNYVRGFARGVSGRGVPIFTGTKVASVRELNDAVLLATERATVRARKVIFATNAYTDLAACGGDLSRRIVPVSSSLLATAIIPENVRATIMRCNAPLTDTKRLLNGYRLLPDGRLLVAGRADLTGRNETISAYRPLQKAFADAFPAIDDIPVAYRWSGMIAVTLDQLPHVGMISPRIGFALGCGGRGVLLSHLLGRYAAHAVLGESVDAGPMSAAGLRPIALHGWRHLGMNLLAGYYGLRDRIDRRSA